MTDLQRFIDTYKHFGVNILVQELDDKILIDLNGQEVSSTKSLKFGGYSTCSSTLEFDKNGLFLKQDFWEG